MPLNFPWKRPEGAYSSYQTNGPEGAVTIKPWPGHDITFVIEPATRDGKPLDGFHTGRLRYRVECQACPAHQAEVHPATTGPAEMIEMHLEREHGYSRRSPS